MANPWDNPIAAPSYGAPPNIDFSKLATMLGGQQQQQQQPGQSPNPTGRPYNPFTNPNPNGLAARLMSFLNPQDLTQTLPGSLPTGQGGIGSA